MHHQMGEERFHFSQQPSALVLPGSKQHLPLVDGGSSWPQFPAKLLTWVIKKHSKRCVQVTVHLSLERGFLSFFEIFVSMFSKNTLSHNMIKFKNKSQKNEISANYQRSLQTFKTKAMLTSQDKDKGCRLLSPWVTALYTKGLQRVQSVHVSIIQAGLGETFPRTETKIVLGSNNSSLKVAGRLGYISKISSKVSMSK